MNGRAPRRGRNRRQISSAMQPIATNATPTVTVSTTTVTINFDKPVILNGTPTKLTVATVNVLSATQVTAQQITVTLSASGAGKAWSLGANDPAIRTFQGGYASPAAGTFP